MDDDDAPSFIPVAAGAALTLVAGLFTAAALADEEADNENAVEAAIDEASSVIAACLYAGRSSKRSKVVGNLPEGSEPDGRRKKYIRWDRNRATKCIIDDYLGAHPSFGPEDFKRMFRVSRGTYERIRVVLCRIDPFFRDGIDVTKRKKISCDAKILIALKYLSYGCSVNAFRDYFQVGESTALLCVKKFIRILAHSELRDVYCAPLTAADTKKIESMHHEVHGIRGMLGSLDCSHVVWGNCPVAYHGQYVGKEGKPTIVVEAMCDYTLYGWHAVFGYAGTLNDISIWDSSLLLQSFCDGSFENKDFPFTIGGEEFDKLYVLVDGIYPPIARFVKPLSVPIGDVEALFSLWQESKRKDAERFFGVFKIKFNFFRTPIQFGAIEEIMDAFYSCLILHNIAVLERIEANDDSRECWTLYDCVDPDAGDEEADPVPRRENLALRFVQQEEEAIRQRALEVEYLNGLGIHVLDDTLRQDRDYLNLVPQYQRVAQFRWNQLYNMPEHRRLTKAISRQLKMNYDEYKSRKGRIT